MHECNILSEQLWQCKINCDTILKVQIPLQQDDLTNKAIDTAHLFIKKKHKQTKYQVESCLIYTALQCLEGITIIFGF